jgi:hypothetical protein
MDISKNVKNLTNTATKSKDDKAETKSKIQDFMPHWKDEERCFAETKLRDAKTKKL